MGFDDVICLHLTSGHSGHRSPLSRELPKWSGSATGAGGCQVSTASPQDAVSCVAVKARFCQSAILQPASVPGWSLPSSCHPRDLLSGWVNVSTSSLPGR